MWVSQTPVCIGREMNISQLSGLVMGADKSETSIESNIYVYTRSIYEWNQDFLFDCQTKLTMKANNPSMTRETTMNELNTPNISFQKKNKKKQDHSQKLQGNYICFRTLSKTNDGSAPKWPLHEHSSLYEYTLWEVGKLNDFLRTTCKVIEANWVISYNLCLINRIETVTDTHRQRYIHIYTDTRRQIYRYIYLKFVHAKY